MNIHMTCCALVAIALTAPQAQVVKPPSGFVALYNGRDLTGWRGGDTFDHRKWLAMPEDERAIRLLEQEHVLVHPGYFFDFPRDGYLVVSLLAWPDVFRDAIGRLLATVVRA